MSAPTPPPPPNYPPPAPRAIAPEPGNKTPWYRKAWVLSIAALLIGVGIGGASGTTDPKTTSEYKSMKSDLANAEEAQADAEAELKTIAGELPEREQAVDAKEEELAVREADVAKLEKSVAKREKAVGIIEKEIAANTIDGDGIYEVGVDMKPGKYKMAGADCYYSVNGDANGDNIIANNNVNGPAVVEVRAGQYFETSRCADWVLQR